MSSKLTIIVFITILLVSCSAETSEKYTYTSAEEILNKFGSNAFCYGGYRHNTRDSIPSITELKEDLKVLNALGCHLIRTYQTQQFGQEKRLLEAIRELNKEEENFEMYIMLGAWIQCKDAWTDRPIHDLEDTTNNKLEINQAIDYAQKYPEIVKIIAVGNEAMVHWAESYWVAPDIILKYVNQLQKLKENGLIDSKLWVTSSDNFASWGGGPNEYKTIVLEELIRKVDFVSIHTYPFHDTHYNPEFWDEVQIDTVLTAEKKILLAIDKSVNYAKNQFLSTQAFIQSISPKKLCSIGETGWASMDNKFMGATGSKAADEFKQGLYYKGIRQWTIEDNIPCFYFQIFNEPWKDRENVNGSENHFGLISETGNVKFALWKEFDESNLSTYTRHNFLSKSYNGNDSILQSISIPL